jgi:hypothetical protein
MSPQRNTSDGVRGGPVPLQLSTPDDLCFRVSTPGYAFVGIRDHTQLRASLERAGHSMRAVRHSIPHSCCAARIRLFA